MFPCSAFVRLQSTGSNPHPIRLPGSAPDKPALRDILRPTAVVIPVLYKAGLADMRRTKCPGILSGKNAYRQQNAQSYCRRQQWVKYPFHSFLLSVMDRFFDSGLPLSPTVFIGNTRAKLQNSQLKTVSDCNDVLKYVLPYLWGFFSGSGIEINFQRMEKRLSILIYVA